MAVLTLAAARTEIPLLRCWEPAANRQKKFNITHSADAVQNSKASALASSAMDALLFALLSLGPKAAVGDSSRLNSDVAFAVHLGRAIRQLDCVALWFFLEQSSSASEWVPVVPLEPGFLVPCCTLHGVRCSTSPALWIRVGQLRQQHEVWRAITRGRLPSLHDLGRYLVDPETGLFDASELCRLVGVATLVGQVDIALILSRLSCGAEGQWQQTKALDPAQWGSPDLELDLPCLMKRSLKELLSEQASLTVDITPDADRSYARLTSRLSYRLSYSLSYGLSRLQVVRRERERSVAALEADLLDSQDSRSSRRETKLARDTIKALTTPVHNRSGLNPRRLLRRSQPPPRFYKRLQ
jgi:hypothetical protein